MSTGTQAKFSHTYKPHPLTARVNVKGHERHILLRDNFNLKPLPTVKKRGNQKKKVEYIRQPGFYDSETSYDHSVEKDPIGWVYQWAMEFNNELVVGRYVMEFAMILKEISDFYGLDENKRMIIFVHNNSYDFVYYYQFLLPFFGEPEILAIKSHKILTARFGGIEFRCSYMLSNMSLATWGKKLGCHVTKMVGAIDYDSEHYPDEELPQVDWDYMANDVLALKECVYRDMDFYHDTAATVPLTSTGYVRRDVRRECVKDKSYRSWFRQTRLSPECYGIHKEAFAGGLTHGNRFMGGQTVGPGGHTDAKSHYPSCEQLRYMPDGDWRHYFNLAVDGPMNMKKFDELLSTQCCLIKIIFKNLKVKAHVTCPCISKSKILNYWDVQFRNDWDHKGTDNGKVLNAYGYIYYSCTELDFYWIAQQYDWDELVICDLWTCSRGEIKAPYRKVINSFFKNKESLPDGELRDKSKNKLNGIYGMTATDPVRMSCSFNFETLKWSESKATPLDEIAAQLDKYYSNGNNFNPYSYGVYCTAWARYILLHVIQNIVGYENFIYCDTDSVYYLDPNGDIKAKLEAYNEKQIKLNKKKKLGVKNLKGKMSYYGVFSDEGDFKEFRFLHSKCYAYVDMDDQLHVTIAGVTRDNKQPKDHPDYMTSAQELGSIDNLVDGFVFRQCGGTTSSYVESPVNVIDYKGHRIEYASRCIIKQTTKELGGTVEGIEFWEEAIDEN